MVHAGGAIELGDDRRQLGAHAPFVGAAAGVLEHVAPPVPPPRHEARNRLDDEHTVAAFGALEQSDQQRVARFIRQLVHGERRQDRAALRRQSRRGDVGAPRRRADRERPIRLRRLGNRPRMPIDADEARRSIAGGRPCRTGRAGAAADVEQRRDAVGCARKLRDDVRDEQEVKRSVEERERGAFAGAGERGAFADPGALLDVGGRERAQRARDFGKGQLCEMSPLEIRNPPIEGASASRVGHACSVSLRATPPS